MEEQKQTEITTSTKKSIGVVTVAVITLLMGASLVVAAGIVLGLANMKKMPQKNPKAAVVTEYESEFLEADYLINNIKSSGTQEIELSEIKVASKYNISPSTTKDEIIMEVAQFLRNMGVPEEEIVAGLNDESKLIELSPIFAPENEDKPLYEVFQEIGTVEENDTIIIEMGADSFDPNNLEVISNSDLTPEQLQVLGDMLSHMQDDGSAYWSWMRQQALMYAGGGALALLTNITNIDVQALLASLESSDLGQLYSGVRGWMIDRHFEFQCSLNGGASFQWSVNNGTCVNLYYDSKTEGGTVGIEGAFRF